MPSPADVSALLGAADRLQALRGSGLVGTPPEPAFDRVTRLASRLLQAPVSLISLVDDTRQCFKSAIGLPEPWASRGETPLSHSFCQHVVLTDAPLVVTDARTDDRVRDNLAIADLGVIAYLGVPLRSEDGHVLGSLCVIDGQPRQWSEEDLAQLTEFAAIVMDEVALRQEIARRHVVEDHLRVLVNEMNHRVQNTFALVDSIVHLSIRNAADLDGLGPTLRARIQALAATHALALNRAQESIDLGAVVSAELAPLAGSRAEQAGPAVSLATTCALYVSMALHELATNAVKYGALSVPQGRLAVDWRIEGAGEDRRIVLTWRETNGPPVATPTRKGFGSVLFDRVLGAQLGGTVVREFRPEGVLAVLEFPWAVPAPAIAT